MLGCEGHWLKYPTWFVGFVHKNIIKKTFLKRAAGMQAVGETKAKAHQHLELCCYTETAKKTEQHPEMFQPEVPGAGWRVIRRYSTVPRLMCFCVLIALGQLFHAAYSLYARPN